MPWFKVDDKLAVHPKAVEAGNKALGLWVRAGSWSMSHLTDGFIPANMIPVLGGAISDAKTLVKVGLWVDVDGGWQFRDWMDYQPTAESIRSEREATAKRVAKHRNKGVSNGVTNGVSTDSPVPVPYPVPIDSGYLLKSSPVRSSSDVDSTSIHSLKQEVISAFDAIGVDRPFEVRAWFEHVLGADLSMPDTQALAAWILAKAKGEVRNVDGYLRKVCSTDPGTVAEGYQLMDLQVVA